MSRGRFITLEGGEGAGKSTQIGLLAAKLHAVGTPVITTREPGGSPAAEEIRRLIVTGAPGRWTAQTEALLISAARADHVATVIEPNLALGVWVLCDRFADSTTVYQGYGRGMEIAWLDRLRQLAIGDLAPDLTLVIDVPPEKGLARAAERKGDETRFEQMDIAFHHTLRDGFRAIAAAEPARCALIDGTESQDAVHRAICDVVAERLGVSLGPI